MSYRLHSRLVRLEGLFGEGEEPPPGLSALLAFARKREPIRPWDLDPDDWEEGNSMGRLLKEARAFLDEKRRQREESIDG